LTDRILLNYKKRVIFENFTSKKTIRNNKSIPKFRKDDGCDFPCGSFERENSIAD
jgi:hypothetical protein